VWTELVIVEEIPTLKVQQYKKIHAGSNSIVFALIPLSIDARKGSNGLLVYHTVWKQDRFEFMLIFVTNYAIVSRCTKMAMSRSIL
jgi:hypothetical protein